MKTWDLRDKVVFITGAARGIGAATAQKLAGRGARVSLVGLEPERLQSLAGELGRAHAWFHCDVTDQASLDSAVAGTVSALGGIDVVVANAGVANNGTVAVNPADAVARTLEVNLVGVARTVSATLPHVTARKGYMLLISSAAAFRPIPGMAAYCASKVGVEYFGDALRMEVQHKGVDVGLAHPSWIDTDMVRDQQKDLALFNDLLESLPYPFSAYTSVEDCAAALVKAITTRQRKVFIPEAMAPFAAVRSLFFGAFWEKLLSRRAVKLIPQLEEQVQALGRAFGPNSSGLGAKPQPKPGPGV